MNKKSLKTAVTPRKSQKEERERAIAEANAKHEKEMAEFRASLPAKLFGLMAEIRVMRDILNMPVRYEMYTKSLQDRHEVVVEFVFHEHASSPIRYEIGLESARPSAIEKLEGDMVTAREMAETERKRQELIKQAKAKLSAEEIKALRI